MFELTTPLPLIIIGTIIISFGIYRIFKFIKQREIRRESILNKIEKISLNLNKEITDRENKTYFDKISIIENDTNENTNIKKLTSKLSDMDNIYVDLKSNFRILDEFEEFQSKFSYKKRKYKQIFDRSLDIINMIEEKYTEDIKKYLVSFNDDYNEVKENDIKKLNSLMKDSIVMYNEYNIKGLKENLKSIIKLDIEISMMIDEPSRLRDKLLKSEDNINQLENELLNKKGSLYYKVLETLKNNKVRKEDTDEWNTIKKTINNFKRSKLLKNDIIESSNKLNDIINSLSELNDKIKQDNIEDYIEDNDKIIINSIIK